MSEEFETEIQIEKSKTSHVFEYQTPATLNQAAPVQNTWYTLLDTTPNCRVYGVGVGVEDTNESLEARITLDGQVLPTDTYAATHSTSYFLWTKMDAINRVPEVNFSSSNEFLKGSFLVEGRSVKIEVRKTTATGAGNLIGVASYGRM